MAVFGPEHAECVVSEIRQWHQPIFMTLTTTDMDLPALGIDVTDLKNCAPGDEAILFGEDLLASELAQKSGTISWEILAQITPRVARRYS